MGGLLNVVSLRKRNSEVCEFNIAIRSQFRQSDRLTFAGQELFGPLIESSLCALVSFGLRKDGLSHTKHGPFLRIANQRIEILSRALSCLSRFFTRCGGADDGFLVFGVPAVNLNLRDLT